MFEYEGQVYFNLFDRDISILIERGSDLFYANKCIIQLNSLKEELLQILYRSTILYCNELLKGTGGKKIIFRNDKDVLSLIIPKVMIVPKPQIIYEPIVNLVFQCDWEEEYGLQWILRGEKVMYVGAFEDLNPWEDCDTGRWWNYVK